MSSQQHVNFVTDINVAYMEFGALKQHSDKRRHMGFTTQLEEAKQTGRVKKVTTQGNETVTGKSDEQKCKQKVLQEFFIKKSVDPRDSASAHLTKDNGAELTSKLRASEQKSSTSYQPTIYPLGMLNVTKNSSQIHLLQRMFLLGLQRCPI